MDPINGTDGADGLNGTSGDDTIYGLGGNDILWGNGGNDHLYGGDGDDMLDGGTGQDVLDGGLGDDRLIIDDPNDIVIERPGEGHDTAITMVSYTLPAGASIEEFDSFEAAGSINLTGNELSQTIRGNTSDNVITGGPIGSAPDILIGGGGNDLFYVNNVGDTVIEDNALGFDDRVNAAVDFTLAAGSAIATLIARAGTSAINLTGNDLNQTIIGNDGANALSGHDGRDVLVGGGGADTLDGGDGVDTVDYSQESGGGNVIINLGSSTAFGVAAQHALDTYGNTDSLVSIERVVTGNGNDVVIGSDAADTIETGAGKDTVQGGAGDDIISGGAGADTLTGGAGADTFIGTHDQLNGDVITDFAVGDRIVISDASLDSFTFNATGQALTFDGVTMNLGDQPAGKVVASAAAGGGVQLTIQPNAQFVSYAQFDLNSVNLNWYDRFATGYIQQPTPVTFDGNTYYSVLGARADDGVSNRELDFLGSDITIDENGTVTGGTIDVLAEFDLKTNAFLWYVEGVTISATALYAAALTPSNADELGLVQTALAGNDVITLSPFSDRMNGFAGDDRISGGLGADILTGGSGNDTFVDTEAGHSGDTITDFTGGDRIVFSDASIDNFSFSLNGHVLNYTGGSLTLTNVPDGTLIASAEAGGGVQLMIGTPPPPIVPGPHDFNGDGFSDVILHNDNGSTIDWMGSANGALVDNSSVFSINPGTDWHVEGTGDFNGDGLGDVLWRNDSGTVVTFLGAPNGSFVGNVNFNLNPGLDWHVEGTGDFNGDGRDDILWRNDAGTVVTLLGNANGSFTGNVNFLLNPGLDWHVEGTGDFNGDGRSDILWRNDAGTVVTLLGNANGSFTGNVNFQLNPGLDWHIAGTGDFNGDGRDDILWRNDVGNVVDLLGNADGSFTGNVNFQLNPGLDWHIVGTGDYNGDGYDDILWRSDSGTLTDLLGQPNGAFVGNVSNFTATLGTDWHVQPEYALF